VIAEIAGNQGNVPRLRIATIQGALEGQVFVQNEEPTAGGGIPGAPIITAVDRERLLNRVAERARLEARSEIGKTLAAGETLVEESLRFTPLEVAYDGEIGQESPALGIRYRAQAAGVVVDGEALDRIARQAWTPTVRPGFQLLEATVRVQPPKVAGVEDRTVTLDVHLSAQTRAEVDTDQIAQLARWQTADEAQRVLSLAYSLKRPPEVRFTPAWAGRAYRIQVVLASGDDVAGAASKIGVESSSEVEASTPDGASTPAAGPG
jgi:hypothetical protein